MFSYSEENYFLSLTRSQAHLALYALFLFTTPIFLTQQLLAGVVVNALLISAALKYGLRKNFFLAFVPSLGAVAGGLLFASFTPYLLAMLPFIGMGNLALMAIARKLIVTKAKSYFLGILPAVTGKTALLFLSAFILYSFSLVPAVFLTAFGVMQFITAMGGAIVVKTARLIKNGKESK
jgi:general stress protein CsbA